MLNYALLDWLLTLSLLIYQALLKYIWVSDGFPIHFYKQLLLVYKTKMKNTETPMADIIHCKLQTALIIESESESKL